MKSHLKRERAITRVFGKVVRKIYKLLVHSCNTLLNNDYSSGRRQRERSWILRSVELEPNLFSTSIINSECAPMISYTRSIVSFKLYCQIVDALPEFGDKKPSEKNPHPCGQNAKTGENNQPLSRNANWIIFFVFLFVCRKLWGKQRLIYFSDFLPGTRIQRWTWWVIAEGSLLPHFFVRYLIIKRR